MKWASELSVGIFFFKEIYPIFRKVLCRTLKLIILFKNHFYYVLFRNSILMGNFTKRKALPGVWFLWCFCPTVPKSRRLLRDSNASWSCDLLPLVCLFLRQTERTMGHMPDGFLCHTLILEVRRPFIHPLGGRWGFLDCREANRGVSMLILSIKSSLGLQYALEAKGRQQHTWDFNQVTSSRN